jgi:hypothetical protein
MESARSAATEQSPSPPRQPREQPEITQAEIKSTRANKHVVQTMMLAEIKVRVHKIADKETRQDGMNKIKVNP